MSTQIYKPKIIHFQTKDKLFESAENLLIDSMFETLADNSVFRLNLTGGHTPSDLYKRFGNNGVVDWNRIEIFQTDERFVDSNSSDSNQKMIIESLGSFAVENLYGKNFFRTDTDINTSLGEYEQILESLDTDNSPFFDFTIIGIGNDGHIASLFPGGDYLNSDKLALKTLAPDFLPVKQRLSMSLPVILSSKKILVLLVGDSKEMVLEQMVGGSLPAKEFPCKFLLAHPKLFIYQVGG